MAFLCFICDNIGVYFKLCLKPLTVIRRTAFF